MNNDLNNARHSTLLQVCCVHKCTHAIRTVAHTVASLSLASPQALSQHKELYHDARPSRLYSDRENSATTEGHEKVCRDRDSPIVKEKHLDSVGTKKSLSPQNTSIAPVYAIYRDTVSMSRHKASRPRPHPIATQSTVTT